MTKSTPRLLVISLLLSAIALSGCGFKLRGSETQLTDTGRIYVDATDDISVLEELRKVLSDRAFTVVENRDQASILLRVTNEQLNQRIVSVQSTGQVSEFELNHSVAIEVAQSENAALPLYDPDKVPNRVEVVREYTYDQVDVLGKEGEAGILRREMRTELVLQIVLRTIATLASSSVAQAPIDEANRAEPLIQ